MKKSSTYLLMGLALTNSLVLASQAEPSVDLADLDDYESYYEYEDDYYEYEDDYYDDEYWDECYDDYGNYYCDDEEEDYEEDESYYEEPAWEPADGFTDISSGDWYYEAVTALFDEGVVSGYKDANGNLTGEYGPTGTVTRAEMLKIVLEVGQFEAASHSSSDTSAHGQWYEGYVAMKEDMGLSLDGNWNQPITRREVAVLMSEAYDLTDAEYDYYGQFGDISDSDPDTDHLAAVYEYGIFMGDSGTGNFRPSDNMNRAEAAKVAYVAYATVVAVD